MESLGFYNEDDLWGWVMQWTSDIKYMNTGTHAILIISFDCCRKFFSNQKMNQILIWYEKVCKWLKKIYLYILIRVYHCFCILRRSKIMQLFHTTFSIRSWHLQGREKKKRNAFRHYLHEIWQSHNDIPESNYCILNMRGSCYSISQSLSPP